MTPYLQRELALYLLQAAPSARMASFRVIAAIVLVALICGLIYVLRNVRSLKVEVLPTDKIGKRGRDRTMIFIGCAVTFVVVCVLLFVMARA